MKVSFYILLFSLFLTTFALAQDSLQTPYFPFTEGDTLVYSVHEFSGIFIENSRIVFTKDSLDEHGTRHLLVDYEGYDWPIAFKFEVDSLGNVYADGWWSGLWKVFYQNAEINKPWIAYNRVDGYELAQIESINETTTYGVSDTIIGIEYYYHWDDSTSLEGLQNNYGEWSKHFGVMYKFNYEGGPQHVLKGVVKNGEVYGDTTAVFVSTEQKRELPESVHLFQNYPNPFNPVTVINFQLPVHSEVRLEVFDMLGRRVALLANGMMEAGTHEVTFDASGISSGVYLYRLTAGSTVKSRKLTLIK